MIWLILRFLEEKGSEIRDCNFEQDMGFGNFAQGNKKCVQPYRIGIKEPSVSAFIKGTFSGNLTHHLLHIWVAFGNV